MKIHINYGITVSLRSYFSIFHMPFVEFSWTFFQCMHARALSYISMIIKNGISNQVTVTIAAIVHFGPSIIKPCIQIHQISLSHTMSYLIHNNSIVNLTVITIRDRQLHTSVHKLNGLNSKQAFCIHHLKKGFLYFF